jgi:hypothetical protein
VKYTQRTILTPIPPTVSWDALNAQIRERCLLRRSERVRGSELTIGERLVGDQSACVP